MDSQLKVFDRKVLRIPPEQREVYLNQVDFLVKRLKERVTDSTSFGVIKFAPAGSLRKGTILRPRDGYGVDADIAVYLDDTDATDYDLDRLHHRIRRLLIAIYPQKEPEDFEVQPRTLGIVFHESGLNVDLVPIIAIDGPGEYGLQPSSRGEPPVKTSIPGQLDFLRTRAKADPRFRTLVRFLKRWRNQQELEGLRSYPIELLLAYIQDQQGPAESLEGGLLRFFLFIAQTELAEPVSFPENGDVRSYPDHPVVVLDPVNSENNVTARITVTERNEIVHSAKAAWETLSTARRNHYKGETLEYWKEVFGRAFVIEE